MFQGTFNLLAAAVTSCSHGTVNIWQYCSPAAACCCYSRVQWSVGHVQHASLVNVVCVSSRLLGPVTPVVHPSAAVVAAHLGRHPVQQQRPRACAETAAKYESDDQYCHFTNVVGGAASGSLAVATCVACARTTLHTWSAPLPCTSLCLPTVCRASKPHLHTYGLI